MQALRIGVAGVGHFGRFHALKLAKFGVLAGLADASAERAAVVAWLNGCATEGFILLRINEACDAEKWALAIERGEHRREEEK